MAKYKPYEHIMKLINVMHALFKTSFGTTTNAKAKCFQISKHKIAFKTH